MVARTEDNSERKRISIPKADESTLAWWDNQKDPGLSLRLLVRAEIERNGFSDTAYRPVAQLPRRGRPPQSGVEDFDGVESEAEAGQVEQAVQPALPTPPAPVAAPTPTPAADIAAEVVTQPATPAAPPAVAPVAKAKPVPAPVAAPVVTQPPAAPVVVESPEAPAAAAAASSGKSIDDIMNSFDG